MKSQATRQTASQAMSQVIQQPTLGGTETSYGSVWSPATRHDPPQTAPTVAEALRVGEQAARLAYVAQLLSTTEGALNLLRCSDYAVDGTRLPAAEKALEGQRDAVHAMALHVQRLAHIVGQRVQELSATARGEVATCGHCGASFSVEPAHTRVTCSACERDVMRPTWG